MKKEIETLIEESPFGDTGARYSGMLGMTQHFLLQLKSYRLQRKTIEAREHLEADIRGYEEILKSSSEENASNFYKIKRGAIEAGERFANNERVIEQMKSKGIWK